MTILYIVSDRLVVYVHDSIIINPSLAGRKSSTLTSLGDDSVDSPNVKAELTSHQYEVRIIQPCNCSCTMYTYMYTHYPFSMQSYRVVMVHKVRSNTEVLLGECSDSVH